MRPRNALRLAFFMQDFIRDRFTSYSINPVLILNEIDRTIRIESNPNLRSIIAPGFTIQDVRDERDQILSIHAGALPEQISDQDQLCKWVQEVQDERHSFTVIARFLTTFEPTERSPDGPDEYDFITYIVNRKFYSSIAD